MDNVQNILLQTAAPKRSEQKAGKPDDRFHKMMEQCKAEPSEDEATPQESLSKEEEIDVENMQQLAAMQAMQTVIVPTAEVPENAEIPEGIDVLNGVKELQNVQMAETGKTVETNSEMLMEAATNSAVSRDTVETPDTTFAATAMESAEKQTKPEMTAQEVPGQENGKEVQTDAGVASQMKEEPEHQQENRENVQVTDYSQNAPVFWEVDTAPVKVSEAAIPVSREEAANVADQVMAGIQKSLEAGNRKLEVQLNPQNLGKIRIELTEHKDGSLHIALHAEHSDVRAMLESKLPEMQQMLKSGTGQDVQMQVPQQEKSQQQFYDDQGRHQQQQQEQRQKNDRPQEDFLNQLRLGLVDETAS